MLSNYTNLAISLKDKFRDINEWPEITFDSVTTDKLSSLPNVKRVNSHSIQFEIEDNQVVIPSQYILFTVCIKELAIKLHNHLELFEHLKQGKSTEEVGAIIANGTYNLEGMNLDEYSQSIAFTIFTNPGLNMSAKSIINGASGNYKLRSASDFFGSVILKIINVPDASSAILGKLIFQLCKSPEVYSYLERTYLKEIPYVLKSSKIGQFVKGCLEFFIQYSANDWLFIESSLIPNSEPSLFSIKDDDFKLTSIFKKSKILLPPEGLLQGGKPRFFIDPIYIDGEGNFLYLSTEWTYNTESRLDLTNFILFLEKKFPMFIVEVENGVYILKPKQNLFQSYDNIFSIDAFVRDIKNSGLVFDTILFQRFVSSLCTKSFVILTGLTGSGKTKLAQSFVSWICDSNKQYSIVPVGADWTNREPLLGYPNSLKSQHYVKPDSGVLDILLRAHENYIENNKDVSLCKPYFLILDEMNLSHVERYFADFLSAMESGDEIKLYSGSERYDELDASGVPIPGKNPIPNSLVLPKNLFIIGTVNIDETTYMFSPKVLDRANTIEFRISSEEMAAYLDNHKPLDMEQLLEDVDNNKGKGAIQTEPFMALAARKDLVIDRKKHQETFVSFFKQLQGAGTEFGYRTANEMTELVSFLNHFSVQSDEAYDIAIMQKLLPKLNGSRSKLSKVLPNLGALCLNSGNKEEAEQLFNEYKVDQDVLNRRSTDIKFKLSFEKLCRMNKNAQDNGFASYAEA